VRYSRISTTPTTGDHGTRTCYQAGCACTPCRAANAAYIAHLRASYRQHRIPLGHLVSASEAVRRVGVLLKA
jgi:hypothetical protein